MAFKTKLNKTDLQEVHGWVLELTEYAGEEGLRNKVNK